MYYGPAIGYYDTRTKDWYTKYDYKAWLERTRDGRIYYPASTTTSRMSHYQYITSYRTKNDTRERRTWPVNIWRKRRLYQMHPHPCTILRYNVEALGHVDVIPRSVSYDYHQENGFRRGVLESLTQTGFDNRLPTDLLPASQAYQKAMGKQDPMQLNLSENLGEIRETIKMLRNPLQGISRYLRRLGSIATKKQKNMSKADHAKYLCDALTGSWLEYRYGIMPLVYTSVDLLTIIQKMYFDGFLITKGSHEPIVTKEVTKSSYRVGDLYYNGSRLRTRTSQVYCIVTGAPDYVNSWQDTFGLRVTNIPFVALELTRLSFVLEWFVNVSSMMRQAIPFENRYIHSVQLSYKTSCVDEYTVDDVHNVYNPSVPFQSAGAVKATTEQLVRQVNPQIPIELNFGTGISSLKRLLDSISLGLEPGVKAAHRVIALAKQRKL